MVQFVFSNLIVIMRKYSNNPRESFQNFMTDLFESIGCNCVNYECNLLPSNTSSRIMTRVYDVPNDVRKIVNECSNDQLENNLNSFFNRKMNRFKIDTLITELKKLINDATNISSDEKSYLCNINMPILMIKEALIYAIRLDNRLKLSKKIWTNGVNCINLVNGDLMALSFNKKECLKEKIVVIPVDCDFHLHISGANDSKPEVSKTTLHGQWLMRMEKEGFTRDAIERMIVKSKTDSNEIGSISKVIFKSVVFYLVGLSKFDKNNIAHSDKKAVSKCVMNIMDEYNKTGQGVPLYMPLMGTGRSRIGLSNEEAIDFLIEECKNNKEKIQGTVNILVHTKKIERIMEEGYEL